ncbi:glycosyltransferase family 2 protein [Roseospira goensis]|uniref:GT2 family glycosyltransferase n=1 Tax=Roseospira goensis TaxID=391922 RepID=A0A7W6WMD3_9PROT|nr:glycosyltransferase family 2 protein [Roseospira goensis]MBB4287819.1 GT2 family glycosyltransferase [Roseospira goensis]
MLQAYVRMLRRDAPGTLRKTVHVLRREGLDGIRRRVDFDALLPRRFRKDRYQKWILYFEPSSLTAPKVVAREIAALRQRPLFSVLMPVHNPPEDLLAEAIESVRRQSYPDWELCITDDASTEPHVARVLQDAAKRDSRIKVHRRAENGHISAASNDALAMASGGHVVLLDHDDALHRHALYWVARELDAHPDADLIYSDEDKIDMEGRRHDPHFKSDWNPDLMLSYNMVSHIGVYRTALVRDLGGFRSAFDGAQDYDLALRVSEHTTPERIRHIPRVLYHWRAAPGSCARDPMAKDYAHHRARAAVAEHLARTGHPDARVEVGYAPFVHRVVYPLPTPAPAVSIIIPTKDRADLLAQCVDSVLERTTYPGPFEVLVVNNRSEKPETFALFDRLRQDPRVRVEDWDHPYNYAALNNWAVGRTDAPMLAFLNNDTEVITPGWLDEMVRHALRDAVGPVGARLLYPDGAVQHAGIVIGLGGVAGNAHVGVQRDSAGYAGRARVTQDYSAVTAACLVMRRTVFEALEGFDAEAFGIAFNDVDLCLRAVAAGWRCVYTPDAELYHHESATLGVPSSPQRRAQFAREVEAMQDRWADLIAHDPAYSPNLSLDTPWFEIAGRKRAPSTSAAGGAGAAGSHAPSGSPSRSPTKPGTKSGTKPGTKSGRAA